MRDVNAAMESNVKTTIRLASITGAKNMVLLEKRISKATTQCYVGEYRNPSLENFESRSYYSNSVGGGSRNPSPSDTLSYGSTSTMNSPEWDKTDETVLATSAVTSASELIEKAATAVSGK